MPTNTSSDEEKQESIYFNKLNILWLVITVLVFSVLVKLGLWQSDRAIEKEERVAKIENLNEQKALSLKQVLELSNVQSNFNEINDYPVAIKGEFNKEHVFLLDNQVNNGRLGYRVFQTVVTKEYSVLVSLGWVQGSINRQVLPVIKALNGHYQFRGNIRLIEEGVLLQEQVFADVSWPLRVQQIELEKFSLIINRKLLPFVVYLDKNEMRRAYNRSNYLEQRRALMCWWSEQIDKPSIGSLSITSIKNS